METACMRALRVAFLTVGWAAGYRTKPRRHLAFDPADGLIADHKIGLD